MLLANFTLQFEHMQVQVAWTALQVMHVHQVQETMSFILVLEEAIVTALQVQLQTVQQEHTGTP